MKVTKGEGTVKRLYITDAPALDPVTVLIEDFEPGKGRITIICWGEVWTSYWGSMSGQDVGAFVISCNEGYLLNNLAGNNRLTKVKKVYLTRIIAAVKSALERDAQTISKMTLPEANNG